MKIVVQDAPALKAAVDSIVCLVEEGQFELKEDGLYFRAMDPSQISMVSFRMPKEAFVEYSISEETKLGIDIGQFAHVLARGKKGESIELTTEEGRLVIKFFGEKHKRTFKVPLIETGERVQKEPKIEFGNFAKVRADAIKETLKDAKLLSSHVRLHISPELFGVDVRGDTGDLKAEFEKGSDDVAELNTKEGAGATFPLQYLEDMVRATSSSSIVTVNLETDKPLKLEYDIEGARVVYYLAPRIETE
jgi:proliferating cell nuclear antigen